MNIPFLDLPAQFRQIEAEILPILHDIYATCRFIGGEHVDGFEEEFARFCDAGCCAGVGSGTDALRFALMAAGVGPDDEVITVPNTFIATTEAISQVGARPVFVDIDPKTANMDVSQIEGRITPKTKAIVPVHLYGQPADMDPILAVADKHGLVVVEDACQAHGALYKGRTAGSMGQFGCFSFYPGKNLGAFGEAGAVVSNDREMIERIKMIRDHGQAKKYFHDMEGFNGRLDAIQAAVLRVKLKRLPDWNQARKSRAALYTQGLSDLSEIKTPAEMTGVSSVYHLYVIETEKRDALQKFLGEKGIGTGLHYPLPLHMQKAYQGLGYKQGDFPAAEHSARRLLSLPMFPELTGEQVGYVVDAVKEFFQ